MKVTLVEPEAVCLLLILIQLCIHTLTQICVHSWSGSLKYIVVHIHSNLSYTKYYQHVSTFFYYYNNKFSIIWKNGTTSNKETKKNPFLPEIWTSKTFIIWNIQFCLGFYCAELKRQLWSVVFNILKIKCLQVTGVPVYFQFSNTILITFFWYTGKERDFFLRVKVILKRAFKNSHIRCLNCNVRLLEYSDCWTLLKDNQSLLTWFANSAFKIAWTVTTTTTKQIERKVQKATFPFQKGIEHQKLFCLSVTD